jgi:hypothetical protein
MMVYFGYSKKKSPHVISTVGFKNGDLWFTEIKLVFTTHEHKIKPILFDYIYHKNRKSKPCETDLPLLKSDITRNFWT